MKKIILIITAVLLSSLATQVIGQNFKGKINKNNSTFNKLNLSENQETKFQEIRFKHQERKIDIESELKKNRLEVKKMMTKKNIKEEELMTFINKGIKLRSELQKSRVKMWYSIYNILEDDQKAVWQKRFNSFGYGNRRFEKADMDCFNCDKSSRNKGRKHRRQFFN